MQQQTQVKGEMTGRAVIRHLIKLYSNGVNKFFEIENIKQLHWDIDEDPIIKDSMAYTGAVMVSMFGKWLPLILIGCHTLNHTKGFVTAETTKKEEELEE